MGNIFKAILTATALLTVPAVATAQTVDTATVSGGSIINTGGAAFVGTPSGTATGSLSGDILTLTYDQDLDLTSPPASAGDNFNTTGTLSIDFSGPSGSNTVGACTFTGSGTNLCGAPGFGVGVQALTVTGDSASFTTTQVINGNNSLEVTWTVTYVTVPPVVPPAPAPEPQIVPTLPLAGLGLTMLALSAAAWRGISRRK